MQVCRSGLRTFVRIYIHKRILGAVFATQKDYGSILVSRKDNEIFMYIAESSLNFLRNYPQLLSLLRPPEPKPLLLYLPSSLSSPSKLSSTPSTILPFISAEMYSHSHSHPLQGLIPRTLNANPYFSTTVP